MTPLPDDEFLDAFKAALQANENDEAILRVDGRGGQDCRRDLRRGRWRGAGRAVDTLRLGAWPSLALRSERHACSFDGFAEADWDVVGIGIQALLQAALEAAGAIFVDENGERPGVRLRKGRL